MPKKAKLSYLVTYVSKLSYVNCSLTSDMPSLRDVCVVCCSWHLNHWPLLQMPWWNSKLVVSVSAG